MTGSPAGVHRQPSSRSSLAAVVYGMVRARRRHTSSKQGVLATASNVIQQSHARVSNKPTPPNSNPQGALDRLKAFSSMRRHPTPSSGTGNNNGTVSSVNSLQQTMSSPPKMRHVSGHNSQQHLSNDLVHPATSASHRLQQQPLHLSKSFHDVSVLSGGASSVQMAHIEEHQQDDVDGIDEAFKYLNDQLITNTSSAAVREQPVWDQIFVIIQMNHSQQHCVGYNSFIECHLRVYLTFCTHINCL